MESPVKKLELGLDNKENDFQDPDVATITQSIDANHAATKDAVKVEGFPTKAPALHTEELDEPILRENPQRFVLFPIQYHEVRDAHSLTPPSRRVPPPPVTR